MRRLVAETRLHPADLVLPLFVREGLTEPAPIASMPGVVQHARASMRAAVADAAAAGLGGVMLFGVPETRDAQGSGADDPDGVLSVAVRDAKTEAGDALVVMADLCLDEFTDHGHCGVLDARGTVDNDATLVRYASMARVLADCGVDVVGTSGMMDGQVAAVRNALDDHGAHDVAILAYAAKYASAFYGPFRDAVDSALTGDRRTYQQDPANARESLRELLLDVDEGADIVMVKPAMSFLDIVRDAADEVDVPVAAYQVSGEFSMIEAAAHNGWIDRDAAILESLVSIRRAGAQIVVTYFAADAAALIADVR
jgi:porphobilinogen synthase